MIRLMGLTETSEDYSRSVAWAIIGQGTLVEQEAGLLGEYLALGGFQVYFLRSLQIFGGRLFSSTERQNLFC